MTLIVELRIVVVVVVVFVVDDDEGAVAPPSAVDGFAGASTAFIGLLLLIFDSVYSKIHCEAHFSGTR
jgi:hypothetical protein